jgi:hypothetical protein
MAAIRLARLPAGPPPAANLTRTAEEIEGDNSRARIIFELFA